MALQTAFNSETGQTVVLVNNQWVPVGQTATNDQGQKAYLVNNQWLTEEPLQKVEKAAPFSMKDIATSFGMGALGSTQALTDVAGAQNVVSAKLGEASKALQAGLTPERQAELQRQQERMKAAEKEGTMAEVKAAAQNIAEAPLQSIAQGIGSFVPYLPAMFAAPAATAMRLAPGAIRAVTAVADAAPKIMGTAQGAGAVKSSIYDSVYEAEKAEGTTEQLARQKATAAQDYFGKNFDQIALGAGLGLAASATGIEKLLTPSGKAAAAQGLGRRVAGAVAAEAPMEAAQGGQERLAANIAQRREGRDVGLMTGVAGQATQEGLIGGLSAGPVAALRGPGATKEEAVPPAPAAPEAPAPVAQKPPALLPAPEVPEPAPATQAAPTPMPSLEAPEPAPRLGAPAQAGPLGLPGEATPPPDEVTPPPSTKPVEWDKDYTSNLPEDAGTFFQNRDRSSEASVGQMQDIAARPDYSRLSVGRDFGSGAPVVITDKPISENQFGKTAYATASDGSRIPVRYAVVDAGDMTPSNSASGSKNLGFGDLSVSTIRPIAGNGRVAGLQAAYGQDTAGAYKGELLSDVEHGIDPGVIGSIANPVLVRVMPKSYITKNIADIGNISGNLRLSPVEMAKNDNSRIDLQGLQFNEDGSPAGNSLLQFVRAMPKDEQGELLDDKGMPNTKAVDRLNNAIFHKAYGSDSLINLYAQAVDPEAKAALNALARVAAKMSALEGAGEYDVRQSVVDAAEMVVNARRAGIKLSDYAQQRDIGTSVYATKVLDMFAQNIRSSKKMAEALDRLASTALEQSKAGGTDMFGAAPKMSLDDVYEALKTPSDIDEKDLFGGEVEKPPEEKPAQIEISIEQEQKEALDQFEKILAIPVPPFKAALPGKTQFLKPKPLTALQKKEILELASKALKLGLPASVLGNVIAAGSTRLDATAIMSRRGWLMTAKHWSSESQDKKLQALIHEFAHAVDTSTGDPSSSAKWDKAHSELESWYQNSQGKAFHIFHPLTYPFAPQFKGKVNIRMESFAQAFAYYFTNPDNLQKNAPEAYSQIQSIIERIQNESQAARAAGKTKTGTAGINVQPARGGGDEKVQPAVSKERAGFGAASRRQDRSAEKVGAPTEAPTVDINYFRREAAPTPTQAGQENLDILDATGMQLQPPEPGRIQKIKDILRAAGENPALTKDSSKAAIKKFLDKMEVAAFSGDAAFNNDIRRNLETDFADNPEILGLLLEASQSQAVHSDALATRFIVDGGIAYDGETKKWVSVKKEHNFIKMAKQIEAAAKKYGLSKEQMEQISHTYFVAKRFKDLLKKQRAREADIERLEGELADENANIRKYKKDGDFEKVRTSERAKNDIKSDIEKLKKASVLISDDQVAMIDPGLSLLKNMPELEDISDTWQGVRSNATKAMMDGGLWSSEFAEEMLDEVAYVPFYRDEQLEAGGGPQEFIKGLQVKGKEYRLKGSNAAVNDIFDNMVRWTQYAINRSVRNHKALQMVDLGLDLKVGDRKMAELTDKMDPKKNTIRVFRDGTQEIYSMADPLYVDAFSSISNVAIPSLKFFTWFSNLLRQSVVLYPLFSVAQVPQDSFSAMFTSGLKTQYALRIPVLAVKEFLKTLAKTSATHKLLESYGATGVRDFNAAVARNDIQIAAGLKAQKGLVGKAGEILSHIAMSADNAVRQAVYEASMQQGLSKAEAIEKAFEIINFRRRGTSKMINLAGQVVPFFYAYMSVQRTAYKTLTGIGISPQKRSEALSTLATTTGAVMTLALLYAMMNSGDDEYEKTPTAVRDRTLQIPGTIIRIPLRSDLFLLPKVITEHVYHLLMEDGFSDSTKFKKSISDGIANAVLSPQPIPQAIKPAFEVAINRDFFQGRPLIGQFEQQKEAGRQFNDNTSEFSKLLGNFGVSPIASDHLIRGMFGSAGGLFLYTTNFMINSDPDVPRPELSWRDALSALPGTSGFVTKSSENALKNDFYALRDEVEKVKNTYDDIKLRSPQELDQFLADEKNISKLGLAKSTDKIAKQLSKIRKAINQITNAPEDLYSASAKREAIKELRDAEKDMLKSVDLPELRKMAMM